MLLIGARCSALSTCSSYQPRSKVLFTHHTLWCDLRMPRGYGISRQWCVRFSTSTWSRKPLHVILLWIFVSYKMKTKYSINLSGNIIYNYEKIQNNIFFESFFIRWILLHNLIRAKEFDYLVDGSILIPESTIPSILVVSRNCWFQNQWYLRYWWYKGIVDSRNDDTLDTGGIKVFSILILCDFGFDTDSEQRPATA